MRLIKAIFAGIKAGKKDVQQKAANNLSHWRYKDLITTPYLHGTDYLWNLAKDANRRKHVHDLKTIQSHLLNHSAFEDGFGDILQYVSRAIKRHSKAS